VGKWVVNIAISAEENHVDASFDSRVFDAAYFLTIGLIYK